MKLFITGANGYLGEFLTQYALDAGHKVTTLTRRPHVVANTSNMVLSLYDKDALKELLKDQDVVIHLAAIAHNAEKKTKAKSDLYRQVNVENTLILARAAKAAGIKRFIFMSSVKVNGERTTGRPFVATDIPQPEDDYGRSKWAAEQALKELFADGSVELVIIRAPLIWGGRVKGNLALIARLLKLGIPLPFRAIANKRDIVSCQNLCNLVLCATAHPMASGLTLMVSDGISRSTEEIVGLVARQMGIRPKLISVPIGILVCFSRLPLLGGHFQKLIGDLEIDISDTINSLQWHPESNC